MPRTRKLFGLLVPLLLMPLSTVAIYDNRFIPLFEAPRLALEGTRSLFSVAPMAATASEAFADRAAGGVIGIPEIYGSFDLVTLDEALGMKGCEDPNVRLDPAVRGSSGVKWCMDGKIQFQGISFLYHQAINKYLSAGVIWYFLRANSRQSYRNLETNLILSTGDREELERKRNEIMEALGLCPGHWSGVSFGDVDAYVRVGSRWDYCVRFRRIDVAARLGVLIPSALSRDESKPAAIPLGGDGFWGVYAVLDLLLEPREDLKVGLYARASKRFKRESCRRFPVCKEPQIFGAAAAQVTVDPGFTGIVAPYVVLENLRDGFGVCLQYTLVYHQQDSWKCVRLLDGKLCQNVSPECIKENVCLVEKATKWGADYITLEAFYDFGKVKLFREFDPLLSLRWDIPRSMIVASRVPKTHRLVLSVDFAY